MVNLLPYSNETFYLRFLMTPRYTEISKIQPNHFKFPDKIHSDFFSTPVTQVRQELLDTSSIVWPQHYGLNVQQIIDCSDFVYLLKWVLLRQQCLASRLSGIYVRCECGLMAKMCWFGSFVRNTYFTLIFDNSCWSCYLWIQGTDFCQRGRNWNSMF